MPAFNNQKYLELQAQKISERIRHEFVGKRRNIWKYIGAV